MRLLDLARLPGRYRPWRPLHATIVARDLFSPASQPERDHRAHLEGCIAWLCHAQDVRNGKSDAGGVSAGWNFEDGWLPSYPETSGYIVETFLAAADVLGRPDLVQRAHRIIDWELSLQASDGAFPGHFGEPGSRPVIFNTGQIMHGLVAGHRRLARADCLEAAVRAGHWLARQQDDDGCWRRFQFNGIAHTYDTRATWALLATALVAGDAVLKRCAIRQLEWALSRERSDGWFDDNAFVTGKAPFTHTIAYAMRGFLESGLLLGEERFVAAAIRTGAAMASAQRADGWLAGTYAAGWVPAARYACLTGVAQMALNWLRLAQSGAREEFRAPARRSLGYLKRQQRLDDPEPIVRGAIAGSAPTWGRYSMFEFPNWAPKFFADALIIDAWDVAVPAPLHAPAASAQEAARV
ncbi:MAG TPA: prenyltransferase/squalene oxidase repeat-containing protein [Caldimonas sp.]|nr:prenyltransferase/squalene oxidase repeat-containing protein [Caldimonas sp.]